MPDPWLDAGELVDFEGVILDCRAGPDRGGYDAGHLVGTIRADLDTDLAAVDDPAEGGRHPLPPIERWAATLGRWGIGPDTPVAVLDAAGGGLYAARAWWMLRAVGHQDVGIVAGGQSAAEAAGVPLTREAPEPAQRPPYPVDRWHWPVVDRATVDARRRDPAWRVVDARSEARWRGEVEPIDPVPGRIRGSVNWPWESTLDDEGRPLDAEALRARVDALLGDVPDERVIVHCGSGVTACQLVAALERAGHGVPALYVGSYGEWCRTGPADR